MLKTACYILAFALVGIISYISMQPSSFSIAREVVIHANPETIFPYINNTRAADEWMPWQEEDPQAKPSYSGPAEGVGAQSSWDSPGKMGTGKAEVIESIPNQVVKTQLSYTKPMIMSQIASISLTPVEDGTKVRWEITGNNNFIGRFFCLFMDMDRSVGKQFEKGLNKLKLITESKSNP